MARELFIRNSRLLKKPLSMSDIVSGHKWSYGTLDDHGRLDEGKIYNNGPLIIYDTEKIGRGIQILDHDSSKEIHLALVLPATEGDVRMFQIYTCEESYIFIHDLFEGEKISKMRFDDFVSRVPSEKKTEFDYRHILINPLTSEELQAIFKE